MIDDNNVSKMMLDYSNMTEDINNRKNVSSLLNKTIFELPDSLKM
jgi:hypothetical protein